MTTVDERGDFVLGDDNAGCLAPRLVEIVGMDAIERSQATPEEFAKADSLSELDLTVDSRDEEEIVEAFNQCLDEDSLLPGFADSFGVEQVPEACNEFFSTETWAPFSPRHMRTAVKPKSRTFSPTHRAPVPSA